MHPGSNDYSMPNLRMVNRFLDEAYVNLVEGFFAISPYPTRKS